MFFSNSLIAQDTVALGEVDIVATKIKISEIGKKTDVVDSTLKQQFNFNSIADVLNFNSTVFIKKYGPGALATTAFRGGNASQTAILWNGFNIQNPMLGQIDLNLLPSILFDNVEIEYGGSSANWGSGAVGGSIHLNNVLSPNKGWSTAVNTSSGSYGLFNASTQFNYSKKRFISSTKLYTNSSKNNFEFKDTLDKENSIKQQQHASYKFYGLLQELKFRIATKQQINISTWFTSNNREIPSYISGTISKQSQFDESGRLTANWSYTAQKYSSTIRAAWFNDKLNYTDSVADIFSKSKIRTFIIENEHFFKWINNQQLNIGTNFTSNKAFTDNYQGTKELDKVSLVIGNKGEYLDKKLVIYSLARFEHYNTNAKPLTGNVSATYFLIKGITARLNVARIYRMPTLNELYWQPGGNINLKPEKGYTFEGELAYNKQFNKMLVSVSGAAFSRNIDNWILWVPGNNGSSRPINIQQVWSRGTETSWKLGYKKNKFKLNTNFSTSYVLSTVERNSQENNTTTYCQLIYTPRYTVNANVSMGYNNFILTYYYQYVGYRFTTSDNTQWLNPYHYSSLRINATLTVNQQSNFVFFAACNNLFNANYTVLVNRPMPLRNFEVGISIYYKQNKTTNNQ
ncbi:MAG: TonB-dependent receptor [Bacteroidota bacterium]|nr:TonB-dependent receptor [Bacteroidota bacterium]